MSMNLELKQGLQALQKAMDISNADATERVTNLTSAVLEYVSQLQLDVAELSSDLNQLKGSVSKLQKGGREIDTVYEQVESLNKALARFERKSERLTPRQPSALCAASAASMARL